MTHAYILSDWCLWLFRTYMHICIVQGHTVVWEIPRERVEIGWKGSMGDGGNRDIYNAFSNKDNF